MIKAFIFDMDGTVIDSTEADFKAWEQLLSEEGIVLSYTDFLSILGATGKEILTSYLPQCIDKEQMLLRREVYFKKFIEDKGIKFIDGVEKFLKEVKEKNIKTALATGAGKSKIDFIFKRLGVQKYFDIVLTAADTSQGKPAPEIFLKAAEKLGVQPSEAIVVEDARNGVVASVKAGMRCIAITSTHPKESLTGADTIVDSYDQLNIDQLIGT